MMKTKSFEVRKGGNVRVKVYATASTKNGQTYTEFKVCDYFTIPGKRKLWTFANEADARKKAGEIAEAITNGQDEIAPLTEQQKLEYSEAMDMLRPFGIDIKTAVGLYCQSMQILGDQPGCLPVAALFYRQNRPDKPFEPKLIVDAVTEFLASQKDAVCTRRHETLTCYLGQFMNQFSGRKLHEVRTGDMEAFLETKRKWSPKTTNDFLGMIGLLYKFAQKSNRNWVPACYNPTKDIDRQSIGDSEIELMEPDELKQMFQRIDSELIPFLVLWCFTGCRKEEAARVTWQQIGSALKKGELELRKDQTKNGRAKRRRGARKMPLLPNARAWLEWWLRKFGPKETGMVLPLRWNSLSQLSDLPKFIRRNTGIAWKENGIRNSYVSNRCKITGNVVDVADEAGNSPAKIERHYRAKSVLLETAKAWFDVMPPNEENIISLPQPEATADPKIGTPTTG